MSATWGRLAGSTATFAVEVRLLSDDDKVASVDPDDSGSWGALRIWANGANLTGHIETDEVVSSLHWYMLPMCEWFVENWDPLLHEERLPMPEVVDGVSGIERMAQQRFIDEHDEDVLDQAVRLWWRRHNLSVGVMGSVLPATIIRRWGDQIEISMSTRRQVGVPEHVLFAGGVTERVPVRDVADALREMLVAVSHELVRRNPGSQRLGDLRSAIDRLNDPGRAADRLELLGAPASIAVQLASALEVAGETSIAMAPPVALLFGTLAPEVREEDVESLSKFVEEMPDRPVVIPKGYASTSDLDGLRPGPMGSTLGEDAWSDLAPPTERPVDIERILDGMGVVIKDVELSDANVRSVCVLSGDRAAMAINPRFAHGEATRVRRFSLAHELCHLLVDFERAVSLAIASGPWAPLDLEQRANAFAAAFLMPSSLVGEVVRGSASRDARDLAELVAREFVVPFTSAIDRLRNLGEFSHSEADRLKGTR